MNTGTVDGLVVGVILIVLVSLIVILIVISILHKKMGKYISTNASIHLKHYTNLNIKHYKYIFYVSVPEERTRRDKASYFGTDEVYDVVKDTTREEVPLQSISLQHNLAYETPSLTQITQEEPQVLFSVTNEAYGVVKDATREDVPLQSISLEHNVAYGKTKPSNEQQPLHIVYDTPLLLQQEEEEYSNIEYEDTEDEDEDDYI